MNVEEFDGYYPRLTIFLKKGQWLDTNDQRWLSQEGLSRQNRLQI